jgi:hypothetical protein
MANPENNNALYFVVGGLVIVAVALGFFFLNPNSKYGKLEPAAGTPQGTYQTHIDIDKNGGTITTTPPQSP